MARANLDPVAVAVLAKAPIPRLAKTRLIPEIGAHAAAVLQERLTERAIEAAVAADTGPATLWGFELEARKDFGFIRPALKALSTTINFSWSDSNVDVGNPQIFAFTALPTSRVRPLIGSLK